MLLYIIPFFGYLLKKLIQLRLFYRIATPSLLRQKFYSGKGSYSSSSLQFVLLSVVVAAMFLTSCEKVIDVDLNSAEKKYVIEGVITDQPNSCKVTLTQTKDFDENNSFTGVSGAAVSISDNGATPVTLTETTPGVYQAASLTGVSGHTYNLSIRVNGQVFTATSNMPALVPFDSLYITERTFFDETNKYATLSYTDPVGKGNAYKYIQYKNGVREKTIFVRDDDLNDGRKIERALLYFFDDDEAEEKKIKTGDNIRVDILGISYPVYKYWYSLAESSTGENNSATPGNPVTNITGGALGYFSVHTIQTKSITVP